MALNIHTDPEFEKYLNWLSRKTQKTKTDLIKELVLEKYRLKKTGFEFGSLKSSRKQLPVAIQKKIKELDES